MLVEGAELLQQLHAVADAARVRRVQEREVLDVAELQRRHLQDHRGQVGPQDLRIGVARAGREVRPRSTAGCRRRARRGRSGRPAARPRPARSARSAAAAPWSAGCSARCGRCRGRRRSGCPGTVSDVSATLVASTMRRPVCGCEHLLLLGGRQPRVERQHLGAGCQRTAQSLGGVADLALAGQEHQHVAGRFGVQFVDRVDDRLGLVADLGADDLVVGVVGVVARRPRARRLPVGGNGSRPDRCGRTPRRSGRRRNARRTVLRLDGRRGDDHLQVRPARQQLAQVAEQEVDVEAALVRLVEDQRVVAQQPAVALDLGEQDAVGHQLDQGAVADLVGEPDRVADRLAERGCPVRRRCAARPCGRRAGAAGCGRWCRGCRGRAPGRSWAAGWSCPSRSRRRRRRPGAR